MKRRTIAALLACTMVIGTLAGCSSEPKNPGDSDTTVTETTAAETTAAAQTGPKVFNDYMTTDIDTLNSHIYTLSASADVIKPTTLLLYRQYPTADGKSFEYIPELAESEPEQVDADGKIWQIKIRENAKWENGDSINVDDVIYSFQMCLDPLMVNNRASQLASDYITITKATDYYLQGTENKVSWDEVGIKRNGDYMLGLELDAPVTAADIKSHFNYVWTNLVHKPTYEAGMNEDRTKTSYGSTGDTYKSCGAYILTEWVPGSVFKMKKNPDYVLADHIKLDEYVYKVVADRNQLMAILNQESSLMEIVKLIGSDVLPDDQKLTLEIARVIRLGFLQQNAFHAEDTCVPMEKQFKMMETILYLYEKCRALINRGMPVSVLKEGNNIFEKIISIKYDVANNQLDKFDQYKQDIDTFYDNIMEKNG